jgi:predicted nuclease of predicted toxin-antitoxin system
VRLLVDQNLPRSLLPHLSEAGHDAVHTADLGLERASDPEVFGACVDDDRVLLTGDKKLTKFLAGAGAVSPSVVVVRGFGGPVEALVGALIANLDLVDDTRAARGEAVFSVAPDRPTRVQLLPLGSMVPRDARSPD